MSIREAASKKNYVDEKFNDPSTIKDTIHVDFDDKVLNYLRFIKLNSIATLEDHLTPKIYVDQAIFNIIDKSSLLSLDPDEKLELGEENSIIFISTVTLPKTITEIPTKSSVDKNFNDPNVIKNTAHVDFTDENLDKVTFVEANSFPANREHLTPKYYFDKAIFFSVSEYSSLRLGLDEKLKLYEQNSISRNSTLTSPKTKRKIPTESYVDSLH